MRRSKRLRVPMTGFTATAMMALTLLIAGPVSAYGATRGPAKVIQIPKSGRITVIAKEFKFIPNAIRARKGQRVTIVFKNKGVLSHNLTIPKLGLHTETIQSGTSSTLVFTADHIGTFGFLCTVPGHKDAGMSGKLIVAQ